MSVFAKKKKTAESALQRGKAKFDVSRRGKKGLTSTREKNERTCCNGERKKRLLGDPGSEFRLGGGEEKEKSEKIIL